MSTLIDAVALLAALVLGALVLTWLSQGIGALVHLSPIPSPLKRRLLRFGPAAQLVLAVAYLASALAFLFDHDRQFAWIVLSLVLTLSLLSWSALYDMVSGVAFRVSEVCQPGDLVQVADVEGRVLAVGARSIVLQTRDGDEAVVPYGSITRRALRRTQSVHGAHVHAFVLDEPIDEGFAELKRRVIDAAIRCHWSSVVHEPKVERREGTQIEVTIYAHDADHAPQVEAAIRRVVTAETASRVFDQAPRVRPPKPHESVAGVP